MRSYREELWFETKTRRAYINITSQVEQIIKKSGIQEGLVLVNAMHITASVYINDDEQGLLQDYDRFLERIAPHVLSDPLADRARYLICSDGLTDLLDQAAIEAFLDEDDQASAQALFEAAMARGGDDNISLILLRVRQD